MDSRQAVCILIVAKSLLRVENLYFGKIWKSCFGKVLVLKIRNVCFVVLLGRVLVFSDTPWAGLLFGRKRLFCLFGNGYINIGILDPANIWKTCLRRVLILEIAILMVDFFLVQNRETQLRIASSYGSFCSSVTLEGSQKEEIKRLYDVPHVILTVKTSNWAICYAGSTGLKTGFAVLIALVDVVGNLIRNLLELDSRWRFRSFRSSVFSLFHSFRFSVWYN